MLGENKKKLIFISSIIFLFIIITFIYYYSEHIIKIFIPFFIAIIIAYILRPVIIRLERKNISCTKGILIIYFGILIFLLTTIIFIIPELINNSKEIIDIIPNISMRYQKQLNNINNFILTSNWPQELKSFITNEIKITSLNFEKSMIDIIRITIIYFMKIIPIMLDTILAMLIAYYFIKDAQIFKNMILYIIPKKYKNWFITTGRQINLILLSFIQGQIFTALIVGLIETITLMFLNVKYPFFLGLIGGIANIIPYFGPIIGVVPAVAVALIDSPIKAVWTIIAFIIIQQIDNTLISPRIIESKIGLHPVTTILVVLIGGEFFGIIGMLISVPVMAIFKVICIRVIDRIV